MIVSCVHWLYHTLSSDSSVSAGTVEQQLMFMYEPESINSLTRELILKLGRSPAYVMALNEKVRYPTLHTESIMLIYLFDNTYETSFQILRWWISVSLRAADDGRVLRFHGGVNIGDQYNIVLSWYRQIMEPAMLAVMTKALFRIHPPSRK